MKQIFSKSPALIVFSSLLFCTLILCYCSNTAQNIYSYSDGSGNYYKIENNTLEYDPVQPHESSSGDYSGGTPVKMKISDDDIRVIHTLFTKAISATDSHNENREMMTGLIQIKTGEQTKDCILSSGSKEKKEIEELLLKLRGGQ